VKAQMAPEVQEHVQSTAQLSAITASQMSPCTSSALTLASSEVESSFKNLIEAATGVPIAHQKLFYGPSGVLVDNNKALYEYEIGQNAMVHLSTRRDPRKVSEFNEERRKQGLRGLRTTFREVEGIENPQHLLDDRIYEHVRKFMDTKVGPKMGKDLVMFVPHWRKAGTSPLKYEWPHEQIWHDYSVLADNGIFDFAGRIRKRFHRLPRMANAAASSKILEAQADALQRSGVLDVAG